MRGDSVLLAAALPFLAVFAIVAAAVEAIQRQRVAAYRRKGLLMPTAEKPKGDGGKFTVFCPWCNSDGHKQPVLSPLAVVYVCGKNKGFEYRCKRCKWVEIHPERLTND